MRKPRVKMCECKQVNTCNSACLNVQKNVTLKRSNTCSHDFNDVIMSCRLNSLLMVKQIKTCVHAGIVSELDEQLKAYCYVR